MKQKLAIISVLKPVNDPRNYKKIGISLAETKKYEINIIGFSVKNIPAYPNIHFYPLFRFSRLSLKRILAPLKSYKILLKVKPDLIIVNTHELLEVIVLYKILFGSKILYDIQENYFKNILYSKAFPPVIRALLAAFVRAREWIFSPFVDYFILAEKCYQKELAFVGKRFVVVENKALTDKPLSPAPHDSGKALSLIYTGTIAEEYGIFDAISFFKLLKLTFPGIRLVIIGYCPNKKTLTKLKNVIAKERDIALTGGDQIVPHEQILEALNMADFAILPYRINTYYSARIPTRIYECLSLKKPMIIRKNPSWHHLYDEFDGFIFTDFKKPDEACVRQLRHPKFYTRGNTETTSWSSEGEKLRIVVEKLFSI